MILCKRGPLRVGDRITLKGESFDPRWIGAILCVRHVDGRWIDADLLAYPPQMPDTVRAAYPINTSVRLIAGELGKTVWIIREEPALHP